MEDNKKALTELLEIIAEHPEIVDKITVVLKPSKVSQDDKKSHTENDQ